jgi:hypothetical protein
MRCLVSLVRCLAIAGGMLSLNACATVFNPGPDDVTFTSDPPGATVAVDHKPVGVTPVTASVDRGADVVTFTLDGYPPITMDLTHHLNWPFVIDIVLLSPLALCVDLVSGNFAETDEAFHADFRAPRPKEPGPVGPGS